MCVFADLHRKWSSLVMCSSAVKTQCLRTDKDDPMSSLIEEKYLCCRMVSMLIKLSALNIMVCICLL